MSQDIKAALQQADTEGTVVGLGGTLSVVSRLDIDQLMLQKPRTFNLFLLALSQLQKETGKMGFAQIAGIHGFPITDWDGVNGVNGWLNDGGYCNHALLTFPTWHRPHVAMMEQAIFKVMLDIVDTDFGGSDAYREAVQHFRLPYLDYYRPRGGTVSFPGVGIGGMTSFKYNFKLPEILVVEEVMVLKSAGDAAMSRIRNPLYSFVFEDPSRPSIIPDAQWDLITSVFSRTETTRRPIPPALNTSNHTEVSMVLNRQRDSSVSLMVNVLTSEPYKKYPMFSTKGIAANPVNGSMESWHDRYHGYFGGSPAGHMGVPPFSGFDPIFWLHHCNVDRLLAIWQKINDQEWWPFDVPAGHPAETAALTPFRRPPGDTEFWTSKSSRKCENFGYDYAELRLASAADAERDVLRRYNWSRTAILQGAEPTAPADMLDVTDDKTSQAAPFDYGASEIRAELLAGPASGSSDAQIRSLAVGNTGRGDSQNVLESDTTGVVDESNIPEGAKVIRQWFVDCEAKRSAFNGTFTIYFFLGPIQRQDDTNYYCHESTFAGLAHFFTAPSELCGNCASQDEADAVLHYTSDITSMLWDYIKTAHGDFKLTNLQPGPVKAFLKKHLNWKVVKVPSDIVQIGDEQGFKLRINYDVSYITGDSNAPVHVGTGVFDDFAAEIVRLRTGS